MIDARELAAYVEPFLDEGDELFEKSKELVLELLVHTPEPFSRRQFTPGHITATAAVLHPTDEAVLVVYHRRLDRWLLPGGHIEPGDRSVAEAARREAVEETGVELAPDQRAPRLVGIDVHGIPARGGEPFHLHHDLAFRFRAASGRIGATRETREAAWCALGDWDRYPIPKPAIRAFLRALY